MQGIALGTTCHEFLSLAWMHLADKERMTELDENTEGEAKTKTPHYMVGEDKS